MQTFTICVFDRLSVMFSWEIACVYILKLIEVLRSDKLTNLEMLELGDNKIRKIENLEEGLLMMKNKIMLLNEN